MYGEVIFRPMVNSGSIPEGEQKIVVYSYVGCIAVLSCPVLLSPHEYGLVQFSIHFLAWSLSEFDSLTRNKFSPVK